MSAQQISQANATAQPDISGMQDILDIKPAAPVPPDLTWLYWLLGGLAVAGLLILLWWLWKRRKSGPPAPPPVPPQEWALSELRKLQSSKDSSDRLYYLQLSGILRGYLEKRFHISALEMTAEELSSRLDECSLPANLARDLRSFLRRAEPIKFANMPATQEQREEDLRLAKRVVERTPANLADGLADNLTNGLAGGQSASQSKTQTSEPDVS